MVLYYLNLGIPVVRCAVAKVTVREYDGGEKTPEVENMDDPASGHLDPNRPFTVINSNSILKMVLMK